MKLRIVGHHEFVNFRIHHFRVCILYGFVILTGLALFGCATTGERLTDSLKNGDYTRADKLIEGDTLNRYTYEFALFWSIRMIKSVEGVRHYLEKVPGGVSHRFANSYRATPLIIAAGTPNNAAVIRLLLERGAGLNDSDSRRMTALDWANYLKNNATATLLSNAGGRANLNEYQYNQLRAQEAREEAREEANDTDARATSSSGAGKNFYCTGDPNGGGRATPETSALCHYGTPPK